MFWVISLDLVSNSVVLSSAVSNQFSAQLVNWYF